LEPDQEIDIELAQLCRLFYPSLEVLGGFQKMVAGELPEESRGLLAHDRHMTVTVEQFHGCAVNVDVLQTCRDGEHYSRKILLKRQADNMVVMFGIVRMNLAVMAPQVRSKIESQQIPLGRILIEHNVLREVKLLNLFRIEPGAELRELLCKRPEGSEDERHCHGRTALIYCDGQPAIELLEIV